MSTSPAGFENLGWLELIDSLKHIQRYNAAERRALYQEIVIRYKVSNERIADPLHVKMLIDWDIGTLHSFLAQVNEDTKESSKRYYIGNCAEEALYENQLKQLKIPLDADDSVILTKLRALPLKAFHDFLTSVQFTKHAFNTKLNHLSKLANRVSNEKKINAHLTELYSGPMGINVFKKLNELFQNYQRDGRVEPLLDYLIAMEKQNSLAMAGQNSKFSLKRFFSRLFKKTPSAFETIQSLKQDLLLIKSAEF